MDYITLTADEYATKSANVFAVLPLESRGGGEGESILHLHPNEARNTYPSLFFGDEVDPGLITKIDESVYQYHDKPTLRGPVTVDMWSPYANSEIRYTLNGKNPTNTSPKFERPLVFRQNATGEKTTVKARIYDKRNANVKGKIIRLEFRVLPTGQR